MTNQTISPGAIAAMAKHLEKTYDRAPFIEDNGERQTITPAAFGNPHVKRDLDRIVSAAMRFFEADEATVSAPPAGSRRYPVEVWQSGQRFHYTADTRWSSGRVSFIPAGESYA